MSEAKRRHGCLTTWLLLMVVGYGVIAVLWWLFWQAEGNAGPPPHSQGLSYWGYPVRIVVSLFNVTCAIALLQWKKWGFWGFCVSIAVLVMVNLSQGWTVGVVAGFVEVAVLYGVLHVGRENKGWPQLD